MSLFLALKNQCTVFKPHFSHCNVLTLFWTTHLMCSVFLTVALRVNTLLSLYSSHFVNENRRCILRPGWLLVLILYKGYHVNILSCGLWVTVKTFRSCFYTFSRFHVTFLIRFESFCLLHLSCIMSYCRCINCKDP